MARGVKFVRWNLDTLVSQVKSVCRVDESGCWIWEYGGCDRDWYPEITISGRKQSVSRWLLWVATGETGEVARHTCDRMPCCNPEHLLWGTQADNMADAIERGRHVTCRKDFYVPDQQGENHWTKKYPEKVKRGAENALTGRTRPELSGERNGSHTHPEKRPVGEQHGRSKLTRDQVLEIRERRAEGSSMYRLALDYGVTKMTIRMIVERKTWRHV